VDQPASFGAGDAARRSTTALGDTVANADSSRVRIAALVGGAVLLPLAAMASYLILSRGIFDWTPGAGDYLAILLSVAVGVMCLLPLPLTGPWRAVVMTVYFLVSSVALFVFAFAFVCGVYGNCI
jgi:hypothetical protein